MKWFRTVLTAVMLMALSHGLPPPVHGAIPSESAATMCMTDAVANVMLAARRAGNITGFGYSSGVSFLGAYITEGANVEFRTTLNAGTRYLILGGGDADARDVDIEIVRESMNTVLAQDVDRDASPVVSFTPAQTGWYLLRLKMHRTETYGSFAAMAILERGGKQVPISNLAEATANLMTFCLALQVHGAEQGHIVGFQSHPNQWAVFGSILGTSEAATVINLHPGEGAQLFVAAGDEQAEDIDLFLTDEEGTYVLASDTGGDSTPLMPQWTSSNRGYGIRAKMIRSTGDRPVMVLTAMLTVQ